jgi:hypothetical protein
MPNTGPVFQENQWFFRRWWWLIMGVSGAIVPLALASKAPEESKALLITAPLLLVLLVGLCFIKLTVRVDTAGIHYQYTPFLNRWRHWPWSEFQQVFPRIYSPLGDYGGWGIRGLPGNLAYNIWGKDGLQLVFRSGNKLLLGTQKPAELYQVLVALRAADTSNTITLATT